NIAAEKATANAVRRAPLRRRCMRTSSALAIKNAAGGRGRSARSIVSTSRCSDLRRRFMEPPDSRFLRHSLYRPGGPDPHRQTGADCNLASVPFAQRCLQASKGPLKRNFDRVRLQTQHLADPPSGQIRPVAEGQHLALSVAEDAHRLCQNQAPSRIGLEIIVSALLDDA